MIDDYFKEYVEDVNGDGEVNVQVINCSVSNESGDVQYRNAQLQKLQAMIASEYKAMLFITDNESIEFFSNENFKGGIFEKEPLALGEDFYVKTESKDFGRLPEGLSISCRRINETTFQNNDTAIDSHKEAQRLIAQLEKLNSK